MITYFATGNKTKFAIAQRNLTPMGYTVQQLELDIPEIQETDIEKIASHSAEYAAEKTGYPVFVSDVGLYIPALNGFPGPFIKYINQWLTTEDFLRLMEGKENRTLDAREAIAYCEPGKKPLIFTHSIYAEIQDKAVGKGTYPLDSLVIWDGLDKVQTEYSEDFIVEYWGQQDAENYRKLGELIRKNS